MLERVGVDRRIPVGGKRFQRADVVEVTVGENDRRWPRAGAEPRGRDALDRRLRARHAGVDQHPAAVARPSRAVEHDVDDGEPEVGERRVELDGAVVELDADLHVLGHRDLLGHARAP